MGVIATPEASSDMPETLKMQNLSRAYVYAIAAKAGVNIYKSRTDLGIDMTFSKVGRRKGGQRKEGRYTDTSSLMLTSQLKSSTLWEAQDDTIVYDLKVDNYNDLVESDVCVLILMCFPLTPNEWLYQNEEYLQLRKCCYYWHPLDDIETTNVSTKRIFISKSQVFTVESLTKLVDEVQLKVQR